MTRKMLATALLAFALPLLNGCGTDGNVGKVRLVNATNLSTSMDLFADGDSKVSGVPADSPSAYVDIKEGTRVLDVRYSGTGTTATSTTQTVSTDKHYSLVAYLSGTALTTQWLSDEDPAPSGAYAEVRVLNAASTQVGGVDVYLTHNACNALTITDVAVSTAVSGLQANYATFATGTYNVCVTAAGNQGDLRLDAQGVQFTSGQVSTLIVTPTTGGVLLNGFLLVQQGALTPLANTSARVRVVADAASGVAVSAGLNGAPLLDAGTSPQLTEYVTVASGAAAFSVVIDGTTINVPSNSITAGGDYTLLVAGTPGAPIVSLITDDNSASTSTTQSVKIRLVNGANGTGAANLLVNGLQVAGNIAVGSASGYTQVLPSAALATITSRAGSTTLWTGTAQTLAANGVYTLFLLGDAADGVDTTTASLLIQDH